VALRSTHTTERGARARLQQGLNLALGNGALRARINRGLERANFELIVRPPADVLEAEFESFLARCEPYTMTSRERMYAMFQATRHLVEADVPGDIVECGVWRGGSAMMSALTLLSLGDRDRKLWLYDTFEGMPEPGAPDVGLRGEDAHAEWKRNQRGDINEWCFAPLDEVRANMVATGLPPERLELVQGKVEDTIPGHTPGNISLLRLDTDWYESTYHELVHLFPLLSPGGVVILDDYGQWAGVRDAVDRYLDEQGTHLLLSRVDYAGRMAIKP
jgi:O-methyltransferase